MPSPVMVRRRALRAGFDAQIGKPLTFKSLTATMQRLLAEDHDKREAAPAKGAEHD